jgi:hypothetical protein
MIDLIKFKEYCENRNWSFDNFCSEFTFQFRLCRYLETIDENALIELESSIYRYNYEKLTKKEIDIDILSSDNQTRTAIELKFIRDQGSYNIGMYKFCEDIRFLEELTERGFSHAYSIIFTTITEVYTKPKSTLRPKNLENSSLYNCFRNDFELKGVLNIKTGKMNESLTLRGEYKLLWVDFSSNIKACIVEISKPANNGLQAP